MSPKLASKSTKPKATKKGDDRIKFTPSAMPIPKRSALPSGSRIITMTDAIIEHAKELPFDEAAGAVYYDNTGMDSLYDFGVAKAIARRQLGIPLD
jgi:hypothetical protein